MGRKGQVTVFIILGIVLMMIFAAVLLITNSTTKESFETEAAPVRESVPQEFTAIQQFVESCMFSVGKKGITVLGQQGGYISPETLGEFSISNPTESVGINLNPLKVPYWHFNQNPSDQSSVEITSLQPALYASEDEYWSIEAQLARYMDAQIQTCLNDFQVFQPQGFTVTTDYPETIVRIRDGEVDFIMEMPLEAQKESANTDMEQFVATVNSPLLDLYNTAASIAQAQREEQFLEHHMINILGIYARPGGDFPPMFTTTVEDQSSDLWFASELELSMKELLQSSIPLLRHQSSNNFHRFEYGESELTALNQQVYDDMILPLSFQDTESTIDVGFNYLNWDPYLDINGGQEKISPADYTFESPIPLVDFSFTMQNYNVNYDISYPVLVTIVYEDQNSNEEVIWNFALEGNIVNNEVYDELYVQPSVVVGNEDALACDDAHKTSGPLSALIIDAYTAQPIDTVDFSFTIPNLDDCKLGSTDASGELESKYPSVYGGMLNLEHDNYLDTSLVIDTAQFLGESALIGYAVAGFNQPVVEMYPEKLIDVKVNHKQLQKCVQHVDLDSCMKKNENNYNECMQESLARTCFFNSQNGLFLSGEPVHTIEVEGSKTKTSEYYFVDAAKDLFNKEGFSASTSIILERVSDVGGEIRGIVEKDHVAAVNLNSLEPQSKISLYPGRYHLTAVTQIEFDEPYFLPRDIRCTTQKEKSCVEIDSSSVDSLLAGSVIWDGDDYLEITADDLYGADLLELNILGVAWENIPERFTAVDEKGDEEITVNGRLVEDLGIIGELDSLARDPAIKSKLQPVWS